MKRVAIWIFVALAASCFLVSDSFARGGRGGGGGGGFSGGGGARPSVSRSPAVSRPAPRPSTPRPSTPSVSRPSTSRPSTSRPSVSPPSTSKLPASGTRPAGTPSTRPGNVPSTRPGNVPGTRPSNPVSGGRPSSGDVQNFLGLKPSTGGGASTLPATRPSNLPSNIGAGVAGGAAGGAAADFLRDTGPRPGTRPETRPAPGERPGLADRPATGDRPGTRPGPGERPGAGNRPGVGERPVNGSRPDRIANRQERHQDRNFRRDEIRNQVHNHPIRDFWSDHPLWGAWAITRPFRWAAWSGLTGWVNYGWSQPIYYDYGENVYYDNGNVYYGDQVYVTAEEFADQAAEIASSAPNIPPDQCQWMPLGVFALTEDGQKDGPDPTLFLQLAISKEGIISGTLNNTTTNQTQTVEGMVDKQSQRCAFNIVGKSRPIMETGISNLTKDTAPALVHFADGTTQQWLLVHLDDPEAKTP